MTFCAQGQKAVDHLGDGRFIAGDGAGRDNDKVSGADLDGTVAGLRHTGQSGQRFALAAGGDKDNLFRRVFADLLDLISTLSGAVQIPSSRAILVLETMLRPLTATLRPYSMARSMICWIR